VQRLRALYCLWSSSSHSPISVVGIRGYTPCLKQIVCCTDRPTVDLLGYRGNHESSTFKQMKRTTTAASLANVIEINIFCITSVYYFSHRRTISKNIGICWINTLSSTSEESCLDYFMSNCDYNNVLHYDKSVFNRLTADVRLHEHVNILHAGVQAWIIPIINVLFCVGLTSIKWSV